MSQNILVLAFTNHHLSLLSVSIGQTASIFSSSDPQDFGRLEDVSSAFCRAKSQLNHPLGHRVGLILPYSWIDTDGKIDKKFNTLISGICQAHQLQPIGFMSSDESILDYFCQEQGVPSSPLLVEIDQDIISVSITDNGQINKRLSQPVGVGQSLPQVCYDIIGKLSQNSVVSPKLLIWGDFDRQTVLDFNNHPWMGKSASDIFLHFPDIVFFDHSQTIQIFCQSINSQLSFLSEQIPDANQDEIMPETKGEDLSSVPVSFVEPTDLGFLDNYQPSPPPVSTLRAEENSQPILSSPITSPRSKFPSILPKNILVYPVGIISFLLALFVVYYFFIYQVSIDLFVSPMDVNVSRLVTLDSGLGQSDYGKKIIAVSKGQDIVNVTDKIKTTGTKTIGEKAQGKVVIFNKTEDVVLLKKGQILQTASGVKINLLNDTQVDASSLDLSQGLISMGKTVTVASAVNIGPEANIVEATPLQVENFSDEQLIARVHESFSGGTSNHVSSVSAQDRQNLKDKLEASLSEKISKNKLEISRDYLLKSTIKVGQPKVEFSREVGEESDSLSASMETAISYLSLDPSEVDKIVKYFYHNDLGWQIDTSTSKLNFDFDGNDKSTANLTLSGKVIIKLDTNKLSNQLVGKPSNSVYNILKSNSDRIYDYNIRTSNPFGKLPFMPPISRNIRLIIKAEI